MTERPWIKVPHTAGPGSTIRLYPAHLAHRFAILMAALYPKLASTVSVKRGYAAFTDDGFVGIMTSTGLTSVRKNPLMTAPGDPFLRALLAGMWADKHTTCSMYCDWDNLGTLRLMQKLGLGARPSRSGHLSSFATPESLAYLEAAIEKARGPYRDHREYAERKIKAMTPAALCATIPTEAGIGLIAPLYTVDVTLL